MERLHVLEKAAPRKRPEAELEAAEIVENVERLSERHQDGEGERREEIDGRRKGGCDGSWCETRGCGGQG